MDGNSTAGVIRTLEPPHTGSQRCGVCFGWIMSATSYFVEGVRHCPNCYAQTEQGKMEKSIPRVVVRGDVIVSGLPAEVARKIEQEARGEATNEA